MLEVDPTFPENISPYWSFITIYIVIVFSVYFTFKYYFTHKTTIFKTLLLGIKGSLQVSFDR